MYLNKSVVIFDSSGLNEFQLETFPTEEDLENASRHEPESFVGVVFLDSMSYRLRFPYHQLPLPSDFTESISKCGTLFNILIDSLVVILIQIIFIKSKKKCYL